MFRKLLTLAIVFCFIPHIVKTTFAEVVINEFSSAISSEDWVELYNNSDAPINLLLYTLYDGSTNTKNFSCLLTPKGFTIINWNNTLNNDGDLIILKKDIPEAALLSERSLSESWLSKEDEEAWKDL